MKDIWDIVKSFIGSVLLAILTALGMGEYLYGILITQEKVKIVTLQIGEFRLILIILITTVFLSWLFISRRHLYIYNGREGAMKANVRLLKKREPKDRLKRYIWSTRVSFWPLNEESLIRKEFRTLLTQKIEKGIPVRRIWQLYNKDDFVRLKLYLKLYEKYDNYSLKCFIGKNSFIPEILSCYGRVVSVSIPQLSDPHRLTSAFHFYGKGEILRWEEYFNILWETSISIKVGKTIDNVKIEELERYFAGDYERST
jgi:hypothetical protein